MAWKDEIIIYWNEEDQSYVAEVPELPGCMVHDISQSDALRNANDAVELWLSTALQLGWAIPEPKGR